MIFQTFKPIAECAKKIIETNGFADRIKLVYKRSNQLSVGKDGDLPKRANILVTEVFDTELIGEGALSTFKHAQDFLLEVCSCKIMKRSNDNRTCSLIIHNLNNICRKIVLLYQAVELFGSR